MKHECEGLRKAVEQERRVDSDFGIEIHDKEMTIGNRVYHGRGCGDGKDFYITTSHCPFCGESLEPKSISEVYDPTFGDDKECECGHAYYRHFDSYDDMYPVGCKYCACYEFKEVKGE